MGKFDYNKIHKKNNKQTNVQESEPSIEQINDVVEEKTDKSGFGKVFNCDQVYLREGDTQDSDYIDILNNGDELLIEDVIGEWCKVTTASGQEGYVMKQFVKLD